MYIYIYIFTHYIHMYYLSRPEAKLNDYLWNTAMTPGARRCLWAKMSAPRPSLIGCWVARPKRFWNDDMGMATINLYEKNIWRTWGSSMFSHTCYHVVAKCQCINIVTLCQSIWGKTNRELHLTTTVDKNNINYYGKKCYIYIYIRRMTGGVQYVLHAEVTANITVNNYAYL